MSYKVKSMSVNDLELLLTDEVNVLHDKLEYHKKILDNKTKRMDKYKNKIEELNTIYDKYYNFISDLDNEDGINRKNDKVLYRKVYKRMAYEKVLNMMTMDEFLKDKLRKIEGELETYNIYLTNYEKKCKVEKEKVEGVQKVLDLYLNKLDLIKQGKIDEFKKLKAERGDIETNKIIKSIHQSRYYKNKGGK